ncbi:MAG: hypothetical protein HKN23_00985 [Verrucomicrobiales bacterium]|nr:hypothetical protein [Verrucomicrobiales bacterium]
MRTNTEGDRVEVKTLRGWLIALGVGQGVTALLFSLLGLSYLRLGISAVAQSHAVRESRDSYLAEEDISNVFEALFVLGLGAMRGVGIFVGVCLILLGILFFALTFLFGWNAAARFRLKDQIPSPNFVSPVLLVLAGLFVAVFCGSFASAWLPNEKPEGGKATVILEILVFLAGCFLIFHAVLSGVVSGLIVEHRRRNRRTG